MKKVFGRNYLFNILCCSVEYDFIITTKTVMNCTYTFMREKFPRMLVSVGEADHHHFDAMGWMLEKVHGKKLEFVLTKAQGLLQ